MIHGITLSGYANFDDHAVFMRAECSCGEKLLEKQLPVSYTDLAEAIYGHISPEIGAMVKETLKDASASDIIKGILKMRKP